ncbi:hypothetical protein WQE_47529 [Paraburkholderia hospita]|uniref:DUF1840 domain-containing protein n=1 Tax=Paraburkholderia hospita TaxID=169430 RepID=A0ABN0F5H7_9BURK|nr:DUF1840 domain-containing protein [Paraburkholderia hospita]EIM93861.1 hypothetical protein WQE_47529 [Paraburkholderia hospita]OUL73283.1 hypothetical protein CA601_44225 [Paraburkholderia hospita]OUL80694.1 hypothetical protein CA602_27465 [Paraburkholderia hospita]
MLVTFQSPAAPDVVMLRDLAQYLLGLVGKRLDTRGVILHNELPGAINRLEAAISDERKTEAALEPLHYSPGRSVESGSGLSQRAWPFLDMMREARKQNADIIWGL